MKKSGAKQFLDEEAKCSDGSFSDEIDENACDAFSFSQKTVGKGKGKAPKKVRR